MAFRAQLSETRLGSLSSEDPSRSSPQDAALENFRFLAFFGCDVLPSTLFSRACKPSLRWDNSGELEYEPFTPSLPIISRLPTIIEEAKLRAVITAEGAPWSEQYTVSQEWKERLSCNASPATCRNMQFAILDMAIRAFPTPWTEISWEEVENQLWDVVQSTCIPFLGVLDIGDVMEYMDEVRSFTGERKYRYLATLSKFLLRLSTLLGSGTPPSIPVLMTDCLEVLHAWPGVEYLYLPKSIAEGQLRNLSHHGSIGLNGTIGLALGSLISLDKARTQNKLQSDAINWAPLCKLGYSAPSTMEILAQVQLFGATSLKDIPGVKWNHLSLETKVLIAFCETKHKSFDNAIEILVQTLPEVEGAYTAKSPEFVLVGTSLINCFNATRREREGEAAARSICEKAFGCLNIEMFADPTTVGDSPQRTYFMISMADSFLGQGKYDLAELYCENVLNHRYVTSDIAMNAALRLLKMSRRRGTEQLSSPRNAFVQFGSWKLLSDISERFHKVSDSLKYEFLEETICFLSVLDPEDTAHTLQASKVVNTLIQYSISYKGTLTSEKNFQDNLEALQYYKNRLNVFSLLGPPQHFCRKIRDRFSKTTVQFAEKIGAVNWQRVKRINEMRSLAGTTEEPEVEVPLPDNSRSKFHDSGIGSSIGFSTSSQVLPKVARSVTSIRSFMPLEKEAAALPDMPPEILSGEVFICFVCERIIRDISNRSQWEAEFAAHLTEHQHITPKDLSCLKCPFCDEIPGPGGFVGHICHHLEEVSLSAIPQEAQPEEEVDDATLTRRSTGDPHTSTQPPPTIGHINWKAPDANFGYPSPTGIEWEQFLGHTGGGLNGPVGLDSTDVANGNGDWDTCHVAGGSLLSGFGNPSNEVDNEMDEEMVGDNGEKGSRNNSNAIKVGSSILSPNRPSAALSLPAANPQTPPPASGESRSPKKRSKVNHACLYCRRYERPCARCIRNNIGHLCHDKRESAAKKSKSQHSNSAAEDDGSPPNQVQASADNDMSNSFEQSQYQPQDPIGEELDDAEIYLNGQSYPSTPILDYYNDPQPLKPPGTPVQYPDPDDSSLTSTTAALTQGGPLQLVQPSPVSGIEANALNANSSQFIGYSNDRIGTQNQIQDMHNYPPNYMFNAPEVTDANEHEYNLLNHYPNNGEIVGDFPPEYTLNPPDQAAAMIPGSANAGLSGTQLNDPLNYGPLDRAFLPYDFTTFPLDQAAATIPGSANAGLSGTQRTHSLAPANPQGSNTTTSKRDSNR